MIQTKRIQPLLFLLGLSVFFSACGQKPKEYHDISSWSPLTFELALDQQTVPIVAHRLDTSEYAQQNPRYYVIEGVASFYHPETGDAKLVEIKLYIPRKTYKKGESIDVAAHTRASTKGEAPYFVYKEYTLTNDQGTSTFDMGSTFTPPRGPTGTVKGTVTIDAFATNTLEGTFQIELQSIDQTTRRLSKGSFRYDPPPPRY